ncbi:shTK domain protein [Teladorsagia circumcincta]|uniref:ShTK domain protein n=1 Tax=Teladorsagia circumcincta TaxID=45464 RepID=A0A2G9U4B3_TELCI|nr:shTK domain protein [Teladorsagia circumcincta]
MMKSLQERLKKLRPIKNDKVQEVGDTITEVNENSQVDQYLYQGDVVLTEEQADEIVEDIEDEVAGGNRTKRQAFKDHRYPKMLWSHGVNYYFHNLASRELRSVFTKGAKLWEKDTCINFTMNRLENCNPAKSAKCEMGGFPHPRDCSKCICPGGYAGDRCTERPSGCGSTIQASADWERLQDTLGFGYDEREDFLTCNYWIESPAGTEIEVRLLDFTSGLSIDGCKYAGVEIKTNKDQTLTGYRFCSPDAAGITLRSYTNRVPIMTYNRYLKTTTVLEYRHGTRFSSFYSEPMILTTQRHLVPASAPRTTSPPSATTRASITTTTTKRPSSTAAFKCEDNHTCPSLVASGFCKGPLSEATKMKVCPKSCGLC